VKKTRLKNLAHTLLATTCLTAATAAAATAGTVDQSQIDGGFGSDFNTASVLPSGTDTVTGNMCDDCGNFQDFFAIPGLTSGETIQITGSVNDQNTSSPEAGIFAFDSLDNALGSTDVLGSNTPSFDVTAPANGEVVIEVTDESDGSYGLNFQVSVVGDVVTPEPATLGLGALALAAGALARRKLKKA
jgi:hypothetical protein